MLGRIILDWMVENHQSLRDMTLKCGLHADRLFALITGDAMPWGPPELNALARAMGLSPDDLRRGRGQGNDTSAEDGYLCHFTVSEVAALVGVSEETILEEIGAGKLDTVSNGERPVLIPRAALVERCSC